MNVHRPGPLAARLLRAPGRLYDWHAGWILSRRFLRLTHTGRRTGRQYRTMLEVIGEDRAARELIVVAGLGRSAQWYRNLMAGKATEVAIGRERFAPSHRELNRLEAAAVLASYERRNRYIAPVVRLVLSWLVGWHYDGTHAKRWQLVSQLPMVGLRPVSEATTSASAPTRGDDDCLTAITVDQVLLGIEEEFWRSAGDRDRYAAHLAADAVHVFPGWGVIDRENVLAGVAEAEPWQSFRIEEPKLIRLVGEATALVYRAHAERAEEVPYKAAITSVYRRTGGAWKLVLHQHTPLAPA